MSSPWGDEFPVYPFQSYMTQKIWIILCFQSRGQEIFAVKCQIVNILGFADHMISVETIQFCCCSKKTDKRNIYTTECVYIPLKLDKNRQGVGFGQWAIVTNLSFGAINKPYLCCCPKLSFTFEPNNKISMKVGTPLISILLVSLRRETKIHRLITKQKKKAHSLHLFSVYYISDMYKLYSYLTLIATL